MTKKQKRFVEEYLIDLNITQAAIRAGYSPKTAYSIGSENLKKPEIRACIEKAMAERSKRTGINQDRIIMELAKIGLLNPKDLVDFDEATVKEEAAEEDLAAIASVRVKRFPTKDGEGIEREIKMHDKSKHSNSWDATSECLRIKWKYQAWKKKRKSWMISCFR